MTPAHSQPNTLQYRPILGIVLSLGFCIMAPLADAMGKLLGAEFWLLFLVYVRFVFQGIISLPLAVMMKQMQHQPRRIHLLMILRTLLHISGVWMIFKALQYLPIADAIAIAYVFPFVVLILSAWLLKETIGPRRIFACLIGFMGTLLVIQPNLVVGWPALLPLGVAVIFAFFMIVTRQLTKDVAPMALQAWSGIYGILVISPIVLTSPLLAENLQLIQSQPYYLEIILLGTLGTVGHWLMTLALKFAPSSTLAPIQYFELPISVAIGWYVFGDWPVGLVFAGLGLIISAGLFTIYLEHVNQSKTVPRELV